jgi:hypothetical protein
MLYFKKRPLLTNRHVQKMIFNLKYPQIEYIVKILEYRLVFKY